MDYRLFVNFDDVDYARVVYFARYFTYVEKAQADILRTFELSHKTLAEEYNVGTPIVQTECQYYYPAKLEDELLIRIRWENFNEKGFSIIFNVFNDKSGKKLVSGKSDHLFINMDSFKSYKITGILYEKFAKVEKEVNA